jgi:transposase InsO family protein
VHEIGVQAVAHGHLGNRHTRRGTFGQDSSLQFRIVAPASVRRLGVWHGVHLSCLVDTMLAGSAEAFKMGSPDAYRALAKEFGHRGKLLIKSLTLDNGTEFHGYAALQKRYGKDFYFAAPYHSWERGTNENTNGLIRQYLPKGSCFKDLTQRQCNAIEKTLNDRPRKTLGYQTPAEAYYAECCT